MAQLLDTSITGSLALKSTTVATGSGGNVWYNSTTNKLQYSTCIGGTTSWSTGGAMISCRFHLAGAGTQNLSLAFGGCCFTVTGGPPYGPYLNYYTVACTEEYDGTSWSTGGVMITARVGLAGAGTQNLGLAINGGFYTCTEEYNGTSWSAGGATIIGRCRLAGAGTQNAALAFGGCCGVYNYPYGTYYYSTNCTEKYNGTSWSTDSAMIYCRNSLGGAGTENLGLAFGGRTNSSAYVVTEEYNGTWSNGGNLIFSRASLAGTGTQNQALAIGGYSCNTELYNGTSWTSVTNMITSRVCLAGAGTVNAGLAFGGKCNSNGYGINCTEEFIRTFATASV